MLSVVTAETVLCWNLHFRFGTLSAGVHRSMLYFQRPHQSRMSWSHRHWNQAVSDRCCTGGFILEFQMNSWHFQLKEKKNSIFGLVTMTSSFPCAWAVFAQLLKWMKSLSREDVILSYSFTEGHLFPLLSCFASHGYLGYPCFSAQSLEYRYQTLEDALFKPHNQSLSGLAFLEKVCEFSVK